jgi:L-amino acid N-acyltransferase YncA
VIRAVTADDASRIALHEKPGFRDIGQFREVGWKFGRWLDVGYRELVL